MDGKTGDALPGNRWRRHGVVAADGPRFHRPDGKRRRCNELYRRGPGRLDAHLPGGKTPSHHIRSGTTMTGSSKTTTSSNSAPWKEAQPALKQGISEAQKLYNNGTGAQVYGA